MKLVLSYHGLFTGHQRRAAQRGVPFLLTYEEWLSIWQRSGHLKERGNRKGQYVMARHGDQGPYSINNVSIILATENNSSAHKGKINSAETRARIRATLASAEVQAKLSAAHLGRTHSPETRAKIAASLLGRTLSAEHRAKISAGGRGKVMSVEARAKIAASVKAIWADRKHGSAS